MRAGSHSGRVRPGKVGGPGERNSEILCLSPRINRVEKDANRRTILGKTFCLSVSRFQGEQQEESSMLGSLRIDNCEVSLCARPLLSWFLVSASSLWEKLWC